MRNFWLAILLLGIPLLAAGQIPRGYGHAVFAGQKYDIHTASVGTDTLSPAEDVLPGVAGQSFRALLFESEYATPDGEGLRFALLINTRVKKDRVALHEELGGGEDGAKWILELKCGADYEGLGVEGMQRDVRKGWVSVAPTGDGGTDVRISVVFTDRTRLRLRYKRVFVDLP